MNTRSPDPNLPLPSLRRPNRLDIERAEVVYRPARQCSAKQTAWRRRRVSTLLFFICGETAMASDEVISNQQSILSNQEKILANQESIEKNQAKLDKIAANQAAILANQDKLDRIVSNQASILANQ